MAKEALTNFIPINRSLFEHHLWREGRIFSRFEAWIYLLKEARFEDTKLYDGNKVIEIKRGQVYASIRFIAKAWKWSPKKVLGFFDLLINDEMIEKETLKETGQTVITICNYEEYNSISEKKKQQRKQQGNSKETKSNTVNKDNITTPSIPLNKCEAVAENWRNDFEIYLSDVTNAYNNLIEDKQFIREREKYHPNLNILLSLEKVFKDYWSTEKAWKKRKRSNSVELDWKETFKKSLDQTFNHVYKQRGQEKQTDAVYIVPD